MIVARLQCDYPGCREEYAGTVSGQLTQLDLEQLRIRAARDGWPRPRVGVTGDRCDYCPRCTADLADVRAEMAAAGRRR